MTSLFFFLLHFFYLLIYLEVSKTLSFHFRASAAIVVVVVVHVPVVFVDEVDDNVGGKQILERARQFE